MRLVYATFVRQEVEPGWPILSEDVPLRRRYRVDLDRVDRFTMTNKDTGKSIELDWVYVLEPGIPGYLPLLALKIEADA